MKYKPLALAAAVAIAGMLSFGGGAQAANVMTGSGAPAQITKMLDGNVQQASYRHGRRHWRNNRWHNNRWRGRPYRSGVFLGLGLAPFYSPYAYRPYYAPPAYYAPPRGSRSAARVAAMRRRRSRPPGGSRRR